METKISIIFAMEQSREIQYWEGGAEHGTSLEYLGDFPGCPVVKTLHFHCR